MKSSPGRVRQPATHSGRMFISSPHLEVNTMRPGLASTLAITSEMAFWSR
jgi:hypothetical protein